MCPRNERLKPWLVPWRPEQVKRFWDFAASHAASGDMYFSKLRGDSLLNQVGRAIPLRGVALDLGAGPGHLSEKLINRGIDTLAADVSPNSVELLKKRLGGNPHFLGAREIVDGHIPFDDDVANVVFLVETVEHLDDEQFLSVTAEARRLLQPGGFIVVTTPNDEDLVRSHVMCPECGGVFHLHQHVRSWSGKTLSDALTACGFETVLCRATLFSHLQPPLRPLHRPLWAVLRRPLPHLLYVGRKRA